MINVKVLNLKDVLKYLVKLTIVLTIIVAITRYFSNIDIKKTTNISFNFNIDGIRKKFIKIAMEDTMPIIQSNSKISSLDESFIEKILDREITMAKNIKIKEIIENNNVNNNVNEEPEEVEIIEEAKTDVTTEVIEDNTVSMRYTNTYGSVLIKNESNKELTQEILTPDIQLSNKKDVLIFHTHTCESYTQSEGYNYEASGNYRTTDLNYSIARVGEELQKYLINYGYSVNHNKTYHDYPAYSGSYGRSLITVKNDLNLKPETEIVFDLHRDAIGSNSNYAPMVKIGDEYAAQLMFVIGTDGGGLTHSNWQQNLKFAIKIQEKANELYPGLFKPIILRNSRYNQHVTKAATILEVGATGNTLEQCLTSMKYLSKIINEVIK